MTTDLDRLIDAVEGDCINWLGWERRDVILPSGLWDVARDAYKGSIDAAVVLLEALLPRWLFDIRKWMDGLCVATVRTPFAAIHQAQGPTPARTLLLATLRAYRSTREGG